MAIVPMKQKITVFRSIGVDEWGRPFPDDEIELDCRVDEGSFVVKNKTSGGATTSKEVVAQARILLDGLVDIREDDLILYKNELNIEIKKTPERINIKRHINGKPLLTEVYI